MSVGRIVLKSISQSKKLANLKSDSARLLYTWLLAHADINGCYYGDPQVVNAMVFTRLNHTTDEVAEYLKEMEENNLIEIYQQNGDKFLRIIDFYDKQPFLRTDREKPQFPEPSQKKTKKSNTSSLPEHQEIVNFWNTQAKAKPNTLIACRNLTPKLAEVIGARLKEYSKEDICKAIYNYCNLLNHPHSRWHYRWNLYEFLARQKDNVGRFLDWQVVANNWIEKNGEQKQKTQKEIEEEQKRKKEQAKIRNDVSEMLQKIKDMSNEEREDYYRALTDSYQQMIFREAEALLRQQGG